MEKNTFIGGAVIVIVLAGIIYYAALRPMPAKAPTVATEALVLPEGKYTENAAYYDIATNYATSTPLSASANDTAIALMKSFVGDTITQFKTDGNFANLTPTDITMMGFDKDRKESLQINYLMGSSANTISYIFTIYEDTLGAHGNQFFHTFTFNKSTGAVLALADLFVANAPYLDTLSSLSRAKLPVVIGQGYDMTFIKDGTTPVDKNFKNFFLDNNQLVFLFAPYQVGPYSAGPQTLRIPLTDLSSILKQDYR